MRGLTWVMWEGSWGTNKIGEDGGEFPTWSWASIEGQKVAIESPVAEGVEVQYFAALNEDQGERDMEKRRGGRELEIVAPLTTCVLSADLAYRDESLGDENEGNNHNVFEQWNGKDDYGVPRNVLENMEGKMIGAAMLDGEPQYWGKYWCVMLYSCPDVTMAREYYGLVLQPVEGFRFRRIGLAFSNGDEYFTGVAKVAVCLVQTDANDGKVLGIFSRSSCVVYFKYIYPFRIPLKS